MHYVYKVFTDVMQLSSNPVLRKVMIFVHGSCSVSGRNGKSDRTKSFCSSAALTDSHPTLRCHV